MSKYFIAKLSGGHCPECSKEIIRGQEIAFTGKTARGAKYRHANCNASQDSLDITRTIEDNAPGCTWDNCEKTDTHLHCARCSSGVYKLYAGNLCAACASSEIETKDDTATGVNVLDILAADLAKRLNGKIDTKLDNLDEIIAEKIKAYVSAPTRVELVTPEQTVIDCGLQHKNFPQLLKKMSARDHKNHRLNIWISGPAGTGKTSAVELAAEALGLDYASTGALIESYRVFGFISPGTGKYVPTLFRNIWENGGVFLFDDCDGSDPSVFVELNNALANGSCAFPDAQVDKHEDCCLVLTANTWGLGATNDYVGRLKQDAATLDRFVKQSWPIDEDLETATAPNKEWTKRVQEVRARIKDKGIKVLVTPRASYYGAALLASGLTWEETEEATLKGAMTDDQWNSVKE